MEVNLLKNAFAEDQAETNNRIQAMERLAEAAQLFEKAGNIKKAQELTDVINRLSKEGNERDAEIKDKLALLEGSVEQLQELDDSNIDEMSSHYLNSAANKITSLISKISNAGGDISESIKYLKNTYAATPQTLTAISGALEVAESTIEVVSKDKSKKKVKR